MKNHWIAVENPSDSMANELLNNSITVFICMVTFKEKLMQA